MQQRTGTKSPAKTPPKRSRSGALRVGADPFHVQQPLAGTPKGPLTPETAPFKRGTKPFAVRTAKAQNEEIRSVRTAGRLANVVGAQHGLTPTHSFGSPGVARDKFTPALTARTEIAKADQARLRQGGLLSPAQRQRERQAVNIIATAPTFHDTHALPASLSAIGGNLKGRTPSGAPPPLPTPHAVGARSAQPRNPFAPKPGQHVNPLDLASRAAGTALEAAASVPGTFTTPLSIRGGGGGVVGSSAQPDVLKVKPTHLSTALEDTSSRLNAVSTKAADALQSGGLPTPSGSIPVGWINIDPQAGAAVKPGTKDVPIAALGAAYLTPEAKAVQDAKAIKRGWFPQELEGLNGLETLKRANSDPPGILTRILRNAAGDIVRTGGVPAAFIGLGTEAATGHAGRAADQLLGMAADQTIGLLKHPVESAISHPYYTIPAVGLAGRTAGAVGLLNRAERGMRTIDTGLTHDALTGAAAKELKATGAEIPQTPTVIQRGQYSRNLWDHIGQLASDKTAKSRVGRATLLRGSLDRDIRNATSAEGAQHAVLQHVYAKLHRKIGRQRSEVLLRLADAGGRADVVLAHYERRAAIDGEHSAAAGQARFIREHVLNHELTPDDQAFLEAHLHLSEHTSGTHVELGRFGEPARVFRQHEALIESLASGGDAQAQRILNLRDIAHGKRPTAESELRTGKIKEAEGVLAKVVAQHEAALKRIEQAPPPRPPGKGAGAASAIAKAYEAHLAKRPADRVDRVVPLSRVRAESGMNPAEFAAHLERAEKAGEIKLYGSTSSKGPGAIIVNGRRVGAMSIEKTARGAGADAQKAWRALNKAYASRVKRAKAQAAALAVRRLDAEKRIGTLKAAEENKALDPKVHEAVQQEYANAVNQFAADHLKQPGAFTPHYVERLKVADSGAVAQRRTLRTKVRFSNRLSKQPMSTGETFRAGDYLIDSQSPMRNSLAAMRMRQTRTIYNTVVQKYGIHHDAKATVPEGMVSVNENTLTSLASALKALEDNPVSHQDYYAQEASIRNKVKAGLEAGSTSERGTTQDKGYFVPKAIYDRMLDYVTPESRNRYDRFLRQYQRALISIYPSTVLGNTLGSIPLAVAGGAIHPHAFADAYRAMKNPELGPLAMRGRGAAAGLASDPRNRAGQYMNFMRRQSVKGEDYSRLAAFFSKASPYIRKRADELNMDVEAYLKKFVKGEIDEQKLSQFLDHAEQFLGDTVKPNGAFGRKAAHVILFHNWVGHMMKVMLYTIPVKHPGRATLINILGQYGDQYRQTHGVWPQWMTDFVPLKHFSSMLPGAYGNQNYTLAGDVTQLTPQGTAGGVLDQLSADRPILDSIANVIAPPWSAAMKTALTQYQAANASPTDLNVPDWRWNAVSNALGMIPGERKFFPTTGQRADSVPIVHEEPRLYMAPHGTGRIQSPFLQPGAMPLGGRIGDPWWARGLGTAARVGGVPLWTVPNEGKITKNERVKAKEANRNTGRSGKSADRRKRRLRHQYEHALRG